jgi:hypothetical protein
LPCIALQVWRKGLNGNAGFIGRVNELRAIKKQCAAGIYGQGGGPRSPHEFDGSESDNGYIKTHVLARLGHFHDDKGFAANEPGRALDGFVGSLHSFDSHASTIADDDCLA